MASQVRPAVYTAVGAVSRRQVRLESLDGSARGRGAPLACDAATVSHHVTHECLLPEHTPRGATVMPQAHYNCG